MIVGVLPVIPTGYSSTQVTRLPSLHICATLNNTTSVRVTSVQMEFGFFLEDYLVTLSVAGIWNGVILFIYLRFM